MSVENMILVLLGRDLEEEKHNLGYQWHLNQIKSKVIIKNHATIIDMIFFKRSLKKNVIH